jgi:hypothetical protein
MKKKKKRRRRRRDHKRMKIGWDEGTIGTAKWQASKLCTLDLLFL